MFVCEFKKVIFVKKKLTKVVEKVGNLFDVARNYFYKVSVLPILSLSFAVRIRHVLCECFDVKIICKNWLKFKFLLIWSRNWQNFVDSNKHTQYMSTKWQQVVREAHLRTVDFFTSKSKHKNVQFNSKQTRSRSKSYMFLCIVILFFSYCTTTISDHCITSASCKWKVSYYELLDTE